MSEAGEASFVVEPYQFEPILTESDCESSDGDSTDGDIGGYDVNEDRIGQVDWWAFPYSLHCKEGILEFYLHFKQFCFYFAARFYIV